MWTNWINMNLISAIIGIDEQWTPLRGQRLAVYAIAMVLCSNEGLACHHIEYWLVLAPGEPQSWKNNYFSTISKIVNAM